jgi:hypothetical protein
LARLFEAKAAVRRPLVEAKLWSGKIHQHHIGALLHSFHDNFPAIGGNIEVANVEVRWEAGQLSLSPSLQIDPPEIFVLNFTPQHDEYAASG